MREIGHPEGVVVAHIFYSVVARFAYANAGRGLPSRLL